jgi:hypothetical protein
MPRLRPALAALALCVVPLAALTACSTGGASGAAAPAASSASTGTASGSAAGSGTASVATPTDMCALLSTDEATAAVGTSIAGAVKADTACSYSGEDAAFSVTLSPDAVDFALAKKLLALDVDDLAPVSGVGDQAAANDKGIVFRDGKVIISIQVDIGTDVIHQDQLVALATTILGHLH